MTDLIRAELLKIRTTRLLPGVVLTSIVMTAVTLAVRVRGAGRAGAASLGTAQSAVSILGAGGLTSLVLLVLGIVLVTAETRHATMASTLLVTPSRRDVIVAKLAVAALVGVLLAVATTTLSAAVGLASGAVTTTAANPAVLQTVAGVALGLPLYGVLGVGVGALVGNQTVSVAGALVCMLVGDALLAAYGLRAVLRWTPGGATAALSLDASLPGALAPWAGALLLAGYGLGFAALGAWRLRRGDLG